jgi:hypothetical protein
MLKSPRSSQRAPSFGLMWRRWRRKASFSGRREGPQTTESLKVVMLWRLETSAVKEKLPMETLVNSAAVSFQSMRKPPLVPAAGLKEKLLSR